MLFLRYRHADAVAYGLLEGETVTPIEGDPYGAYARKASALPLAEVTLLAPVVPSKIIGLVNNFADRAREQGGVVVGVPQIFLKPPTAVIRPEAAIILPPQSQQVEYGAELAVIISRVARWVSPDEVGQYILGYTCANDVTARDVLEADGSLTRGKAFDTFCPLGPVISTTLDPTDALVTGRLNGATRQMTSTHDLLYSVLQVVAFVSSVMTLLPGDVILTGTPSGAGTLAVGDVVEVEIEGIGVLRNKVDGSK